jgi:hypothetical protein
MKKISNENWICGGWKIVDEKICLWVDLHDDNGDEMWVGMREIATDFLIRSKNNFWNEFKNFVENWLVKN